MAGPLPPFDAAAGGWAFDATGVPAFAGAGSEDGAFGEGAVLVGEAAVLGLLASAPDGAAHADPCTTSNATTTVQSKEASGCVKVRRIDSGTVGNVPSEFGRS